MALTAAPKLEDFFGGATMATHHYDGCDRAGMALSLDSMYYHNNQDTNGSQDFLTNSDHHHLQLQEYSHYSAFKAQEMYAPPPKESELPPIADDQISVAKNYTVEQKMGVCMEDNGGGGSMGYGDLQSLSLSMSPGSQSSCVTGSQHIPTAMADCVSLENKKRGPDKGDQKQIVHRKSIDTFGQRTSQYRGVTRLDHEHNWFFFNLVVKCEDAYSLTILNSDIDGREDMKHIYGTTVVRRKVKAEREGKVSSFYIIVFHVFLTFLIQFSCH